MVEARQEPRELDALAEDLRAFLFEYLEKFAGQDVRDVLGRAFAIPENRPDLLRLRFDAYGRPDMPLKMPRTAEVEKDPSRVQLLSVDPANVCILSRNRPGQNRDDC